MPLVGAIAKPAIKVKNSEKTHPPTLTFPQGFSSLSESLWGYLISFPDAQTGHPKTTPYGSNIPAKRTKKNIELASKMRSKAKCNLAEREGFEPSLGLTLLTV